MARAKRAPSELTPKECQIVRLLVQALSDKEIAYRLRTTLQTIRTYNFRIYRKLGLPNRTAVAVWAAGALGRENDAEVS